MKIKNFYLSIVIVLFIFACLIISALSQVKTYQEQRSLLYTLTEIQVISNNKLKAERAITAAFQRIEQIDKEMNLFDPQSELAKINATSYSQEVPLSPDMFNILQTAITGSETTGGAFDVTVTPLSRLYGFGSATKQVPSNKKIRAALNAVGYKFIKIDKAKKTIRFLKKGVQIDLGGIAKGYAVDEAVKVLVKHGIKNALVSAGGSSIYALGTNRGSSWQIAIRDPQKPEQITSTIIKLHNQGLSTSGDYEQYFWAGKNKISHIFDPRTGQPANLENKIHSVTVIAGTATEAEILTKACFIFGPEQTKRIFKNRKIYFY